MFDLILLMFDKPLTESKKLKYKGSVENGTIVVAPNGKIMVCINDGNYK